MEDWQREICAEAGFPGGVEHLVGRKFVFVPNQSGDKAAWLRERDLIFSELRGNITNVEIESRSDTHIDYVRITLGLDLDEPIRPCPLAPLRPPILTCSDSRWYLHAFSSTITMIDGALTILEP